jgi:rhodanese-related sulfurtransferase
MEATVTEVKQWVDARQAVLLDVRTPPEVATAWIDGATVIPMQEIVQRIGELESFLGDGRKLVVFCHHGMRSLRVTGFLRQQGFDNAVSMAGGIDAWSTQVDAKVPRY